MRQMCSECFRRHGCFIKPAIRSSSSTGPPEDACQTAAPEDDLQRPSCAIPSGPSTGRDRMHNLDDEDAEPMQEDHDEAPMEEWLPPTEEEARQHDEPPRKKLKQKTPAEEASSHYRNENSRKDLKRKQKFDYEDVKAATESVKKLKKNEYEDHLTKQSAVSLAAEQRMSEVKVKDKDEPVHREGQSAWSRIHPSHRRALVNKIIYCTKCGCFAVNKAIKLAEVCTGIPTHNAAKAQLKKLNEGRNPIPNSSTWPDGTNSLVRFRPIKLDRF